MYIMSNIKVYAGVGSRRAPANILILMRQFAVKMYNVPDVTWWERDGDALGSDRAFGSGAGDRRIIYLAKDIDPAVDIDAWESVAKYHKKPHLLGEGGYKLMARNYYQIIGKKGLLVRMVVCWTPDGCIRGEDRVYYGKNDPRNTGGTGQAIAIASDHGIPVFNLQRKDHYDRIVNFVKGEN